MNRHLCHKGRVNIAYVNYIVNRFGVFQPMPAALGDKLHLVWRIPQGLRVCICACLRFICGSIRHVPDGSEFAGGYLIERVVWGWRDNCLVDDETQSLEHLLSRGFIIGFSGTIIGFWDLLLNLELPIACLSVDAAQLSEHNQAFEWWKNQSIKQGGEELFFIGCVHNIERV
jgi:hypothetical protein